MEGKQAGLRADGQRYGTDEVKTDAAWTSDEKDIPDISARLPSAEALAKGRSNVTTR
jgi:hypothetical protein